MRRNNVKLGLWIVVSSAALIEMATASVEAAPVKIEAVVSTKEQIRLDFPDGSKHFVAMVRREGKATGQGLFSGAAVTEYGKHDITPGIGGDANGYFVFTIPEGDIAYVKWVVRAIAVPGLNNGVWEVVGGTGKLKGLQGAGTLHIKTVSETDRNFILEGELRPATAEGTK